MNTEEMSMTTSVENLKIHKTGGSDVTYAMGKKSSTSTLKSSMVSGLLIKVIPIRVKSTG